MSEFDREPTQGETAWQVRQNTRAIKDINLELGKQDDRLRTVEVFKETTVDKLLQVFQAVEKLEEKDRWEKRTFTAALLTSIVGAVISAIVWAFQN